MKIEWNLDFPVDSSILSLMQAAADAAVEVEKIPFPCYVDVRICGDKQIRSLNARFRGMDSSTDVLSFPSVQWPSGKTAADRPGLLKREYDDETDACFLGDVVISMDHLKAQAMEYGHGERREAAYLLVHSLCHLMGYDHMNEDEKRIMRAKEEAILSRVRIAPEKEEISLEEKLLQLAMEAMEKSYSPYSHFPVGAALHSVDGRIFLGCNIENASYGATICAERVAMSKAVSEGAREFDVLAIATKDIPGWPCGICRQFLSEFAPDLRIIITWDNGAQRDESSLMKLLPHQFELKGKS